jgi:hypothetical protein
MQRTIKGMNLQHLKGLDLRNAPPVPAGVVDIDHVVGVLHAESQLAEIRQSSFRTATRYFNVRSQEGTGTV